MKVHRPYLLILLAIAFVVTAANVGWTLLDQRPPHWDMARHLATSLNYWDAAQQGHWGILVRGYYYYPPLIYLSVLPWYTLFGSSVAVAVASNFGWLALLLVSVYGLGQQLWNRRVGLVAAIVSAGTPMLVSQFKEFQLDAPLAAVTAAIVYALIRSRALSYVNWSIAVGLALGLGLLLKWTFALIMLVPVGYCLVLVVWRFRRQRQLANFAGVVTVGLTAYAMVSAWYWSNFDVLQTDLISNGNDAGVREGDPAIWTAASNSWYLDAAINTQLYAGLAIVLAVGIGYWLWRKRLAVGSDWLLVALTVVGTYALFTLLPNKDARYTLPMIPLLVVLGCGGLMSLRGRWVKYMGTGLIIYSAVSWTLMSFGGSQRLPRIAIADRVVIWAPHGYLIGAPSADRWYQAEAFDQARAISPAIHYQAWDTIWFNNWGAAYYAHQLGLTMVPSTENAGAMITRTAPATAPAELRAAWQPEPAQGWTKVWSRSLPDGTTVTVWQPLDSL